MVPWQTSHVHSSVPRKKEEAADNEIPSHSKLIASQNYVLPLQMNILDAKAVHSLYIRGTGEGGSKRKWNNYDGVGSFLKDPWMSQ